jgi:ribosomal protein S18 acetylase RimI-like enzyme
MVAFAYRTLTRAEIAKLAQVDRTESIDGIYYVRQGALVLEEEHWDVPDWSPAEKQRRIEALQADYDRGGLFYGAFDGLCLVGMAVLNPDPLPTGEHRLNLAGLWVSHAYRGQGVGRALVQIAVAEAQARGARALYVSATPSERTVRFYRSAGFRLATVVDPGLYEREPEDIHLELNLSGSWDLPER